MTDEELIILRSNYKKLIAEKDRLNLLKNKVQELSRNPIVKEYLAAISEIETIRSKHMHPIEDKPNLYFIQTAVECSNIEPDPNYYVYIGTYKNDTKVDRNNPAADCVRYCSLEININMPDSITEIPYQMADEFERIHKIIDCKDIDFCTLQDKYYETAILESKEKALEDIEKLVLKKKKRNDHDYI